MNQENGIKRNNIFIWDWKGTVHCAPAPTSNFNCATGNDEKNREKKFQHLKTILIIIIVLKSIDEMQSILFD